MAGDAPSANRNERVDEGTTAAGEQPAPTLAWAREYDPSWQPAFTESTFGALVQVAGDCPRCHHHTAMNFPAVIPSSTVKAAGQVVTMFCKCGLPHEGRPDDDFGCGAYWGAVAEL